jgi:signal transduction histidine kinase
MTALRTYFTPVWDPRTWATITYLVLGLPMSIFWFAYVVVMYSVGLSLAIVWVGVPILVLAHWTLRPIGTVERKAINTLLHADVPPVAPLITPSSDRRVATTERWRRWMQDMWRDGPSWRTLIWIMARIVLGPVSFALAVVSVVVPLALVITLAVAVAHVVGIFPVSGDNQAAIEAIDTAAYWIAVGSPVVIFTVPMFGWMVRGLAIAHRVFGRWALGPGADQMVQAATERAELAEQQIRIDQELHDSIGHMITMNIIQAGAGAHVFDTDPEFARQALKNIEDRGRAAMGELDRIIAAIRGDQPETRAPLPGIDDIGRLIEESRTAGMDVSYEAEFPQAPAAVGRAAFTVVREALTNAARHAPGATVSVRIAQDADALGIEVLNGKPSAGAQLPHGGGGRGLSGIRDRITLLGGRSSAGPERGGFAVRALLPLQATLSEEVVDESSPWARLREKVSA